MTHWRSKPDRSMARFRALWVGVTAALLIAAGVVFTVGTARGQDMRGNGMAIGSIVLSGRSSTGSWGVCPADRPHKRTVEGQITSCTAMACIGRLVCDGEKCRRGPATDCNTCSRAPDVEICLSSEELERAR